MRLLSDAELAKLLDKDIFHTISEAADSLGLECYVVGGYVRDLFLERPSNDIDVVVVGSGIGVARRLKERLGKRAVLSVFRNFGTAQVKYRGQEIEFVGARKESYSHDSRKPHVEDGTLEDDQNRRDFTINALAVCLNRERFGQLVDPFNGIADLEDGIICTPLDPSITFSDDPLRMLRCIRFATQLKFYIEDNTFDALSRHADRIKIISGERVEEELNKIMLAEEPSRGFVDLHRCGLLRLLLPELADLDIVETRNGRAHKTTSITRSRCLITFATPSVTILNSCTRGLKRLTMMPKKYRYRPILTTSKPTNYGCDGRPCCTILAKRGASGGTMPWGGRFTTITLSGQKWFLLSFDALSCRWIRR